MAEKKPTNSGDKAKKAQAAPKKPSIFKRLGKYFRDTRGEFKKIVWPSREQVLKNVGAVLVMVVVFAIVIWGLDIGLAWLRDVVINAVTPAV